MRNLYKYYWVHLRTQCNIPNVCVQCTSEFSQAYYLAISELGWLLQLHWCSPVFQREDSLTQRSASPDLGLRLHRGLNEQALEPGAAGAEAVVLHGVSSDPACTELLCTAVLCLTSCGSESCPCTPFLTAHLVLPVWRRHWDVLNLPRFIVGAPCNTDQLRDFQASVIFQVACPYAPPLHLSYNIKCIGANYLCSRTRDKPQFE